MFGIFWHWSQYQKQCIVHRDIANISIRQYEIMFYRLMEYEIIYIIIPCLNKTCAGEFLGEAVI